jgi:hypothetical protein
MNTKIDITGTYLKEQNGFFHNSHLFKLVKAKRQKTNGKPPEFLIIKPCCGENTLPDGTKERYVSGIFWKTANTFGIDFQGTRYTAKVNSDGFSIVPADISPADISPAETVPAETIDINNQDAEGGKGR